MTTLHDLIAQAMQKKEEEKRIAEEQAAKERYWKIPICDDYDDEDYTIAITPVLSTEEPVNSLIMENEHLDTISATESDEFIKSSVEILVPIPSESAGVPKVCDVPVHDNSPPLDISKDQSEDFSDSRLMKIPSLVTMSKCEVPVPETFHNKPMMNLTVAEIQPDGAMIKLIQNHSSHADGWRQWWESVWTVVGNQNVYNAVQNVGNQVFQNAVQNSGIQNVRNQNGLIVVSGIANQNPNGNGNVVAARAEGNAIGNNGNQIRCYNCRGLGHLARNCTVRPRRRDAAYLQTQLLIAQKEEAGIQLQAEEFDLMAAAADLDEIEEVNANCILMANLQQASTSGTQTDKAPVYDSDGSAEVHNYDNCYDNEIFNMFTQEEQYTELLEPIPEPHQVQQNDSNVISEVSSVEQSGGTVDQHPATVEETRAYFESLYNNLAIEVEKVNSVNRKMKETNADLTTELARYKNQEKCFEISQEKYDKLERCYQKSVYQEQCLTKKINALHLSFGKQITTLNEEISNLNKQLSKEKSTVSSLLEEKKKLKSDFKIREDELLDKQIQLENKIKELDNILVKMGQSIQTMHMQKQQSLYNGKVLLEKHDPPTGV
ncbi:retrovirus-related pol polyprotein from transposon TNT 1-94 [Tanacetum coccineum]